MELALILSLFPVTLIQAQVVPVATSCTQDDCLLGFLPSYPDGVAPWSAVQSCIDWQKTARTSTTTEYIFSVSTTSTKTISGCPPTTTNLITYMTSSTLLLAPSPTVSSFGSVSEGSSVGASVSAPPSTTTPCPDTGIQTYIQNIPRNCSIAQFASICECALMVTPYITTQIKTSTSTIGYTNVTAEYVSCSTSLTSKPWLPSITGTGGYGPSSVSFARWSNSTVVSPMTTSSPSSSEHYDTTTPCEPFPESSLPPVSNTSLLSVTDSETSSSSSYFTSSWSNYSTSASTPTTGNISSSTSANVPSSSTSTPLRTSTYPQSTVSWYNSSTTASASTVSGWNASSTTLVSSHSWNISSTTSFSTTAYSASVSSLVSSSISWNVSATSSAPSASYNTSSVPSISSSPSWNTSSTYLFPSISYNTTSSLLSSSFPSWNVSTSSHSTTSARWNSSASTSLTSTSNTTVTHTMTRTRTTGVPIITPLSSVNSTLSYTRSTTGPAAFSNSSSTRSPPYPTSHNTSATAAGTSELWPVPSTAIQISSYLISSTANISLPTQSSGTPSSTSSLDSSSLPSSPYPTSHNSSTTSSGTNSPSPPASSSGLTSSISGSSITNTSSSPGSITSSASTATVLSTLSATSSNYTGSLSSLSSSASLESTTYSWANLSTISSTSADSSTTSVSESSYSNGVSSLQPSVSTAIVTSLTFPNTSTVAETGSSSSLSSTPSDISTESMDSTFSTAPSTSALSPASSLSSKTPTSSSTTTTDHGYHGYGDTYGQTPSSTLVSPVIPSSSSSCVPSYLNRTASASGYQAIYAADYAGCVVDPNNKMLGFQLLDADTGARIVNVNGRAQVPRDEADYEDSYYTFEPGKDVCGVFDLVFHFGDEITYVGIDLAGRSTVNYEQRSSHGQDLSGYYMSTIWSVDCDGRLRAGMIGGSQFMFDVSPSDRKMRWNYTAFLAPNSRRTVRKRDKGIQLIALPVNLHEIETRKAMKKVQKSLEGLI